MKPRLEQIAQDGAADGQVAAWDNAGDKWSPQVPGVVIQTVGSTLGADAFTIETVLFDDLLTLNITTGANPVIIQYSLSCKPSSNNRLVAARVDIDGTTQVLGSMQDLKTSARGATLAGIHKTAALGAGAHVIKIQWQAPNGGTILCDASTAPDTDHASLVVQEVTG